MDEPKHSSGSETPRERRRARLRPVGMKGVGYLTRNNSDNAMAYGVMERGFVDIPTLHEHEEAHNRVLQNIIPGMMPLAEDILLMIGQKHTQRALYLEGPPGQGKTMLGTVIANALGGDCYRIDCGDRPTSELLCEITVNGQHGESAFSHVNRLLAQCEPSDIRIQQIHEIFKKHDCENAIVMPSDDNGVAHPYLDVSAIPSGKLLGVSSDVAIHAGELGLNLQKGMSAGIVKKNGELLQAMVNLLDLDEPNPSKRIAQPGIIILDEYSRRLDDGGALQQLYEVLGGTNSVAKIRGGDGKEYRITARDLANAGVFVLFTANPYDPVRDPKCKPIPPAVEDRIDRYDCRLASAKDFQYLMELLLTGVPLSGYQAVRPLQWDDNRYQAHLEQAVELGMTDRQKEAVPQWQRNFLAHSKHVSDACAQVGEFLEAWRKMEDLKDPLYNSNNHKELKAETTQYRAAKGRSEIPMTLRRVTKLVAHGFYEQPQIHSKARDNEYVKAHYAPEERYGTNLVRHIHKLIDRMYQNRPKAREHLMQEAARYGIYERGAANAPTGSLETGGGRKSIAQLLNIQPGLTISEETFMWQKLLLKEVLDRYPDRFNIACANNIFTNRDDGRQLRGDEVAAIAEQVIPGQLLEAHLSRLPYEVRQKAGNFAEAIAASTHPLLEIVPHKSKGHMQVGVEPRHVTVLDPRALRSNNKKVATLGLHDTKLSDIGEEIIQQTTQAHIPLIPSVSELLMTLSAEGGKEAVLEGIFTRGFSAQFPYYADDMAVEVMENRSALNLGITSLRYSKSHDVKKGFSDAHQEIVHMVRQGDDLLVVGDYPIEASLKEQLFRSRNITYVSRNDEHAKGAVTETLSSMAANTRGLPSHVFPVMIKAFSHRIQSDALDEALSYSASEKPVAYTDADVAMDEVLGMDPGTGKGADKGINRIIPLIAEAMLDPKAVMKQVPDTVNVDMTKRFGPIRSYREAEETRSDGVSGVQLP